MKKTFFILATLAVVFSSCDKEQENIQKTSGKTESVVYQLNIAASMASDTKALSLETDDQDREYLASSFRTTDNIYVCNKTKGVLADGVLHPDLDGKTANLTGGLVFSYFSHYYEVEVGDVLLLSYKDDDFDFTYSRGHGLCQRGTLTGLNDFDFATAEVTVTGISGAGTPTSPYVLTTTAASFTNAQSMFKFTFTAWWLFDGEPEYLRINELQIHSEKNKIVKDYVSDEGFETFDDCVLAYLNHDDLRKDNGASYVVYAALRFAPLEEGETDEIMFTINEGDYIAWKTSPMGGFQNGKYYTSTIHAHKIVNLSNLSGEYIPETDVCFTGTLKDNCKIIVPDFGSVILYDVNIPGGDNENTPWAGITCEGEATIELRGTNSVKGYNCLYPGIQAGPFGTLTIRGSGSLTATYGGSEANSQGAGIGAGSNQEVGNILVESGVITAIGGTAAAGIGGGRENSKCGEIDITGGHIVAIAGNSSDGSYAAGIGTGDQGSCGGVYIYGTATGTATGGTGSRYDIGAGRLGTVGAVRVQNGTISGRCRSGYSYEHATADDVGKLIGEDGLIYVTASDAESAGIEPVALICYVGAAGTADASNAAYHGLAISLRDAKWNNSDAMAWCQATGVKCLEKQYKNWGDSIKTNIKGIQYTDNLIDHIDDMHTAPAASAAVNNNEIAVPTGACSGWFLPTMGQWNLILTGLLGGEGLSTEEQDAYKAAAVNAKFTAAGLREENFDPLQKRYWSSTEYSGSRVWLYDTTNGLAHSGSNTINKSSSTNNHVRAVMAF